MNNEAITVTDEHLSLINSYSRKTLSADDVYVFTVNLCDNEVDRDGERFSDSALQELCKMYVGKTGIFDHSMKTRDQCARVFKCEVKEYPEIKTSLGDTYKALSALAYIPRGAGLDDVISAIDCGIKKEVSVSCNISRKVCSVCGADQNVKRCGHQKGKKYKKGNRQVKCYWTLENPTDVYEWSFVAVPAQQGAGVTKHFSFDRLNKEEIDVIKSNLYKKAEEGEILAEHLRQSAIKYALLMNSAIGEETISSIVKEMDIERLIEFKEECKRAVAKTLPIMPQLSQKEKTLNLGGQNYVI